MGRQQGRSAAVALVAGLLFLGAPRAEAAVTQAQYNGSDLNGGSSIVAGASHQLGCAGTLLRWEDATATSAFADWTWINQEGTSLAEQTGVTVAVDVPPTNTPLLIPDLVTPIGLELFEGRTQIITHVTDGITEYLAATGFNDSTGGPLWFDTDQGAPDHPNLNLGTGVTAPNGLVTPDATYAENRARVEFNRASATPFTVGLNGLLYNLPDSTTNLASPEVFATVRMDILRTPGGSIAPLATPVTTQTHPYTIAWPSLDFITTPPVYDNAFAQGEFNFNIDFTGVVDGTYELRLTATDIRARSSPSITQTTSTIVTVVIDRGNPLIQFTQPVDPFIIGQTPPLSQVYEDGVFLLQGLVSDVYSLPAVVDLTVRDDGDTWQDLFSTTTLSFPNNGSFSTEMNLSATGAAGIAANQPVTGDQVFWIIEGTATDSVGNTTPSSAHLHVIYDLAATEAPVFSFPGAAYATSATTLDVRARLDNVRPGDEVLEEHGRLLFELTVFPSNDPTNRTTFTFAGQVSATRHDSDLDDAVVNPHAPDPLGTIPDWYDGLQALNLDAWPDGFITFELLTIDQVGNRSPITTLQISKGRDGPVIGVDQTLSGPDDNYDVPGFPSVGQPPNQYGSDDLIFIMSLRSPETEDPGVPPGVIPVPFPPAPFNHDPGTGSDVLWLSGTYADVATGVVELRAWGPNLPTTSVTISPPVTSGAFTLPVVVRALPEGLPQVVSIQGRNLIGQLGPVASVVVIRDTVPARAPTVTFPVGQPFFATTDTMLLEGRSEPDALIAVLTPTTTGVPPVPIPRTRSSQGGVVPYVPNPRSQFVSIPATAQVTRADANGRWSFPSLDISMITTAYVLPETILLQAIDVYDNTDPVLSVTPFEIFRNPFPGNIIQVLVDPGYPREQLVHPVAPTDPPTSGQFRTIEQVRIQARFDTLVVQAPELTVIQNGAPSSVAGQLLPAPSTPFTTQYVTYQYNVVNRVNDYDGPVFLSFLGGRDVFGHTVAPLEVSRAFWVDSVAPVTTVQTTDAFFPHTGAAVAAITTLAVDLVDLPATVTSTSSGLAVTWCTLELYGPLEVNPDQGHPLVTTTPLSPYDLAANPAAAITADGTYRIVVHALDNVGNERVFQSTFILDTRPIDPAVVVFNPPCGSVVNRMPLVGGQQAVTATVFDLAVDLVNSRVGLTDYWGTPRALVHGSQGRNVVVGTLATPFTTDGADDGQYTLSADLNDLAGNPTPTVTCTFIYDTTPPSFFEFDPSELACVRDPLRKVQVQVGDPPSPLTTNPITSGVNLDQCTIELRLRSAWYPNKTKAGTVVRAQRQFRILPGQDFDLLALEILDQAGQVRTLKDDGTEDGTYEIRVAAADRAGNQTSAIGVFDYDTQHPRVLLDNFPEDSFFADTNFTVTGQAYDLGPCGFDHLSVPVTVFPTSCIQVRVEQLDAEGNPVTPITTPFFDFQDADLVQTVAGPVNQLVVDRAQWQFTHRIPAAPGRARLVVRALDAAGNETRITRAITIKEGTLVPPRLLTPLDGTVTNQKIVTLAWEPLLVAYRYDLELTRVTPTGVTTSTTFAVPYPTSRFQVDLPAFCSSVPGGERMTTASIFSWRLRSVDVSSNRGEYGTAYTFTVDPNPPRVLDVLVNGVAASATAVATAGPVTVQVDFDDEVGMDPARAPTVTVVPRDPRLGPVTVQQVTSTGTTWTGRFTLPLGGPEAVDPNGPATLVVRGAYDRGGNPLPETAVPFVINIGPWFDVRFFPNPINPPELLFQLVPRLWDGGAATTVPFSSSPRNPDVTVRQQGQPLWTALSVSPIPATTPTSAAFRGAYTVNRSLIGQVDFSVIGTDAAGRRAQRLISANVVEALRREGVLFFGAQSGSHLAIAPLSLKADTMLYALNEENGPPIAEAPAAQGFVKVRSLGWFLPDQGALDQDASVYASLAGVELPCAKAQVGICRWDGARWVWCPSAASGQGLTAQTRRLGAFALMADVSPPTLADPDPAPGTAQVSRRPTLSARVVDQGSGVEGACATFTVDGRAHRGTFDAATGRVVCELPTALSAGNHEVTVTVSDRAGNASAPLALAFASAAAIAVEQPLAYPNPARTSVYVRYHLTQAASSVRVRFYDVAGGTVQTQDEGPRSAGVHTTTPWDLADRRGRAVANGVYVYRIEAVGEDGTKGRSTGKVAVLR